jgi:hypothetical protein
MLLIIPLAADGDLSRGQVERILKNLAQLLASSKYIVIGYDILSAGPRTGYPRPKSHRL